MNEFVYEGGKLILSPTAIESWKSTIQAINILLKGDSKDGYPYESVRACLILVVLVTGFETYSKKRFRELEQEGIKPNNKELFNISYSKRHGLKNGKQMSTSLYSKIISEAKNEGVTIIDYIIKENRIDFQNFDRCKKAYNKTYKIVFGNMEIDSNLLGNIKKYIQYRHRIVHVSPMLGYLNQGELKSKPVFANDEFIKSAIEDFSKFIHALHTETLRLDRK